MRKWIWIPILLISALVLINSFPDKSTYNYQELQYNHKKHVQAGLACTDCHFNAKEGIKATIPGISTCMDCHEEGLTESKNEKILLTLAAKGIQYPWSTITKVPDDVLFSHRRHVAIASIECRTCHGMMQEMEKPPTKLAVKLDMDFCMSCHEEQAADNDCIACHR